MTAVGPAISVQRPILSQDEIAAFAQDGLIVPQARLPSSRLEELQHLIGEMDRQNPGLLDRPVVSPHAPSAAKGDHKAWMAFSTQPFILDLVEQLLGPDIVLWGTALFHKRAQKSPLTVWHRDADFHPFRPYDASALIMWIAASKSGVENGCLRFIPGSQHCRERGRYVEPPSDNFTNSLELADECFDRALARDVEVEPGQVVIFDVRVVHGARPNLGTAPRSGYALRFMASHVHYNQEWAAREPELFAPNTARRPLYLVRGVDRSGLNALQ